MTDEKIEGRLFSSVVTVTVTATPLPATSLVGRKTMAIKNNSAAIVYLGGAAVTTSNGYPIAPAGEFPLDIVEEAIIYGIVAADTSEVRVLEGV